MDQFGVELTIKAIFKFGFDVNGKGGGLAWFAPFLECDGRLINISRKALIRIQGMATLGDVPYQLVRRRKVLDS
jgi:hypothetical protein